MTEQQNSIISRVKKLLAKVGRGATQAESETAIAMASKLLTDHNLEMADLVDHAWVEEVVDETSRPRPEMKFIASTLIRFFGVRISRLTSGRGTAAVGIFGEPANVEIAKHIHKILVEQYRDLFNAHRRNTGAAGNARQAYYLGLTNGLQSRLTYERTKQNQADEKTTAQSQSRELAIVDYHKKVEDAYDDTHGKLKFIRQNPVKGSFSDEMAGRIDSEQINLNRSLSK